MLFFSCLAKKEEQEIVLQHHYCFLVNEFYLEENTNKQKKTKKHLQLKNIKTNNLKQKRIYGFSQRSPL